MLPHRLAVVSVHAYAGSTGIVCRLKTKLRETYCKKRERGGGGGREGGVFVLYLAAFSTGANATLVIEADVRATAVAATPATPATLATTPATFTTTLAATTTFRHTV